MEKLKSRQTKDRIADMLRQDILSGRIEDGTELAQEQLAEILEVSRMPIREALQILEMEGLLLRLPNRHMRVVGLNGRIVHESMRVVAAVEAEIALILMENGILLDNIEIDDDQQFHNWFSKQLNNPCLLQTHKRLLSGYPQYVWETCKDTDRFYVQNEKIRSALNSGDAGAVTESIREYYHNLAQALLFCVKKEIRHE